MRKTQTTLIKIGIAVVLCIIVILIILILLNKPAPKTQAPEEVVDIKSVIKGEKVKEINEISSYLNLKYCIENYYTSVSNLRTPVSGSSSGITRSDGKTVTSASERYKNVLYNLLYSKYKSDNDIKLSDIENLYEVKEQPTVFLDKALQYKASYNTSIYIVEGRLLRRGDSSKEKFNLGVIINTENLSFAIIPWDYAKKIGLDKVKVGDTLNLQEINYELERNEYNAFSNQSGSNETLIREYLENFGYWIVYDKEAAYQCLNKEYSKAKFANFEEFVTYSKNNAVKFMGTKLAEYNVEQKEGYIRYVCKDDKGRYYIINMRSILDYDIMLDTYTLDVPEFLTKYNGATMQEKVILNLNKFMLALNDRDYKYIYNNMLADSFKTANFPTLEEFTAYAKDNFFEENSFKYDKFGSEAGTYYTYDVQITNGKRK